MKYGGIFLAPLRYFLKRNFEDCSFFLSYPVFEGEEKCVKRMNLFIHALFCRYVYDFKENGKYISHVCTYEIKNEEHPYSILFYLERYKSDGGYSFCPFALNFDAWGRPFCLSAGRGALKKARRELTEKGGEVKRGRTGYDFYISSGKITLFSRARINGHRARKRMVFTPLA